MPSVAERLAAARATLEAAGLQPSDAALDAEVLARHVLGWDRASLLTRGRDPEPETFEPGFSALISRRAEREPVAQIVGYREFWGLEFEVTRDVLIPRPETELIVEEALAFARTHPCQHVIDVGTGSGCLTVAIARELSTVRVLAIDRSQAALGVARRNAAAHGVTDRVTFHLGDVLDGLTVRADLIVSNPPYVPDGDVADMQPEVVGYEPHAALFGGPSGLDVVLQLLEQAADRLATGGMLVIECGFGQAAILMRLAERLGWRILRLREDLQGIPRVLVLCRDLS